MKRTSPSFYPHSPTHASSSHEFRELIDKMLDIYTGRVYNTFISKSTNQENAEMNEKITTHKDSKGIWNVFNPYTRQWQEFATEEKAVSYVKQTEATHKEIEEQLEKLKNGEISLSDFLNADDEEIQYGS